MPAIRSRRPSSPAPAGASFPALLTGLLVVGALVVGIVSAPPAMASVASPLPGDGDGGSLDPALLAGLEARSIGPAAMSGRVAAVEVHPGDPTVLWVGSATGGLWRSTDGGLTFEPVFDDQPVASIGAVTVDPTSPGVIWVGTGEGNPRNSASVGGGLFRSTDGGATWTLLGLEETERIHRILLDPRDTDVAYVCALGKTWGDHPQRGVFKTTDGGASWEKLLFVDGRTGCADLVMDPANPGKLFAALWEHRREPWFFHSGGPGSGIHVTTDGGATWSKVERGLPAGDLGRIGLAVAPSEPDRVYALVEAETNGFYRSDDGGRSFRLMSTDEEIGNRPFYYADLRVDPADPDRVYSLWSRVSMSNDGGATWETLVPFRTAHPDHHALWIDPADPRHLVLGNDGGVYVSRDHGETWRFVTTLPLAQYYHVRVDDDHPYHVYGGLQDNGSWRGPAEVWTNGGIRAHHWTEVGFGDGFDTLPDPESSRRGYAMSQEGYLIRWDLDTGERKDIRPGLAGAPEGAEPLRFNWNAAIAQDPFDPATIYYGSQYVHRSPDRGETWKIVSPDLTTDNPEWQRQDESGGLTLDVTGAENFTSLVVLAPSPIEPGLLWAASDDGRLHVGERDGGDGGGESDGQGDGFSWTSVEDNLPRGADGVPEHTWIPHVHPSAHDADTAFVVLDDHRRSNLETYLFETTDRGASFRRLPTDGVSGYALSVLQDPVDPDLLFLGTEFGLWVSFDRGESWAAWRHGVPTVSVMDLALQEREADLVLGTHGRGVFILDDITPLRGLEATTLERPVHLFPIPAAQQYRERQDDAARFPGATEYRGENEPTGALVTFSVAGVGLPEPGAEGDGEAGDDRRHGAGLPGDVAGDENGAAGEDGSGAEDRSTEVTVVVTDAAGAEVRRWEEPVHRGVNRVVWDLRHEGFRRPEGGGSSWWQPRGPEVLPGVYTVTVRFRGDQAAAPVQVLADPRFRLSETERRAKQEALFAAGALQERLAAGIDRVRYAQEDLDLVLARLERRKERLEKENGDTTGNTAALDELTEATRAAKKELRSLEESLWTPPDIQGYLPENTPWDRVTEVQRFLGSSWDAPTANQLHRLEAAEAEVAGAAEEIEETFTETVDPLAERLREAGVGLLSGVD